MTQHCTTWELTKERPYFKWDVKYKLNALTQSPRLSLAFRSWITLLWVSLVIQNLFHSENHDPPALLFFFFHNYNSQVIMKTPTALNSSWRIILTSVTKMIGKKRTNQFIQNQLDDYPNFWKFYSHKEETKNSHERNLMEEKVDSAHTHFFFFLFNCHCLILTEIKTKDC